MAKSGFDSIIDNINKRGADSVVGVKVRGAKEKTSEKKKKPEKKEEGYSLGTIAGKIRDDKTDTKFKLGHLDDEFEKKKPKKPVKKVKKPKKPVKKPASKKKKV